VQWKLLDGVPDEDLQRVFVIARRRRFGRGEVVFHQDDPADSLHLVVDGRFTISRRTSLGEDALLAISGSGEAFGELALVSEANRSATATALDAGETLCVHRVDFDELRARHPSVDRMLVRLLAGQVQRMNQLLSEAFYESAERRVLRRLLELGDAGEHPIRVTQEQLAALAGASRATVNAVLSTERRRGTIEVRRGATLLLDRAALARRAGVRPADRGGIRAG
jgi:CRP/FNR family cyclic AMP-dependent transcriptional regulator